MSNPTIHIKKQWLLTALIALSCAACSKKNDVKPADFDVTSNRINGTAVASFAPKDTVLFKFTGNPDMITFYSGEAGHRYENISRITAAGTPQLQFSSLLANGTQAGSLSLLVSSDFKGVIAKTIAGVFTRDTVTTNANIAAATWTDLTSKATLSTGGTTAVSSGVIDLSTYVKTPVYIAFKYTAATGSIQNKWTITNLAVNNVLADASVYTIASLNGPTTAITNYGNNTYGPGWAISFDPAKNANKYAWVYTDKTSLVITGATTAATATASAEAWAIMGPVDLTRVTPDAGVNIKSITAKLASYQYSYGTAGNYNAVFVGVNATPDASSTVVKNVPITVKP